MKKFWVILLVLLVSGLAGVLFFRSGRLGAPQPEREVNHTASTATAEAQPVVVDKRTSIEAFGVVKATTVLNINIDFPARVRQLYVQEGQKVTLGQPLLALDVDEYRTQIRNTEYELLVAKFELEKAETEIAQLAAEIAKKEAELFTNTNYELSQIQADLAKARQDLETKKELLRIKAIPPQEVAELEKTISDLSRSFDHLRQEKAEEIKKLKAELSLKQKDNGATGSELASINMQKEKIALLEEKLALLRQKLDQNFIRNNQVISNINKGVVVEIGYTEGDLLTPEKKVLSIIDLDSLIVKANIAEEFIKDLRLGAEAVITPVADYSRTYQGTIIRRSEVAIRDNGETVIPVEISIENQDDFLLPNFNVDVKIYID